MLLLLASPVLNLNVTNSSEGAIPKSATQYTFVTALGDHFPQAATPRVELVADTDEPAATAWADRARAMEHVTGSTPPVEINGHWVSRVSVEANQGAAVVREIRADRPTFDNWVGGTDASSVDYTESLLKGAPWAALIIAGATFILLFLMTGSVVIPLTALLISAISSWRIGGRAGMGFPGGPFGRFAQL